MRTQLLCTFVKRANLNNTIEEILPNRTIPLISHAINAHQIWNARITKSQELGVHQVHSLKICLEIGP